MRTSKNTVRKSNTIIHSEETKSSCGQNPKNTVTAGDLSPHKNYKSLQVYVESDQPIRYNGIVQKPNRKGLAAIYRQEIVQDVLLFTSQSIVTFYDKLFNSIEFVLPRASTGRKGFPKEARLYAFIVTKCEGFDQITDLQDFLQCNPSSCSFQYREAILSRHSILTHKGLKTSA